MNNYLIAGSILDLSGTYFEYEIQSDKDALKSVWDIVIKDFENTNCQIVPK